MLFLELSRKGQSQEELHLSSSLSPGEPQQMMLIEIVKIEEIQLLK